MPLLRCPGVYRPQGDTWLLVRALAEAGLPRWSRVLDICTGTGAVAIAAVRAGATAVTAVDVSRSAICSAWLNSRLRGLPIELIHGDFAEVLPGRRFDVVLANPPYVPCAEPVWFAGSRAWNGGPDGRGLLDKLCSMLPDVLAPGGIALIVHSALANGKMTVDRLRDSGLTTAVVARQMIPFGPVLRRHTEWLERGGLISPGQCEEELLVIRADHTDC
ncbi:HemK2/MTQ2 family protein methyltransferase [Nocardia sp. CA-129566]|uniref:HemK2/MTQ2 family protein methyltransferase n=1 Tax=Nocardia sp. CA-129566 TaxID=3239976 RepID=UPI003D986242